MKPNTCVYNVSPKRKFLVDVQFEENLTAAKERKTTKYQDLIEEIKQSGFDVSLNTLEIGSRGMFAIFLSFIDDSTLYFNEQTLNICRKTLLCCRDI